MKTASQHSIGRQLPKTTHSGDERQSGKSARHSPPLRARKRIVIGLAALMSVTSVILAVPTEAYAAPMGTVMVTTQRMSAPTLKSTQNGWYSKGSRLTLTCHERGQSVTGYYSRWIPGGWDDLWYRVSDGQWVADVDINTGTNNPVAPRCSTPPPPAPVTSKATKAANWAQSMIGSNSYDFLCERFVENAYGTSGRYASAIAAYNSLRAAGQIRTTGNPPAGALVFSRSSYDRGYGHVVVAVGNNTYVSGGMPKTYRGLRGGGSTVQLLGSWNPASGAQYLGWAPAPAAWPGR